MSTREKHLYYLSELKDFKVKRKDQDIRGWEVRDNDKRIIGKVDNLLINKELDKVVYVDVEVDQNIIDTNHDPYSANPNSEIKEFINKEGENHIIIPIGLIDLNNESKYAYTESINYQTFAETKRYRSGTNINRDYEHHVLGSYDRNRDHLDSEDELERTRTAYSDEELKERKQRKREHTRNTEESKTHSDRSSNEREEKIRREKENLRHKSDDRSRPVDDHNRNLHRHEKPEDLQPERTIDEDSNWSRDDRNLDEEDSSRRHRNKNKEDFYDRREFNKRD